MLKRIFPLVLLALSMITPARADNQATTAMPTVGPMSFPTFISTYLNPAMRALHTCNFGASAPANGPGNVAEAYQCWFDTSGAPKIALKYYDGTQWVIAGTIDTSSHTFTLDDTAWTSYTPTVGSQGGTITSSSATGRYKRFGKTVIVMMSLTVTTAGSGTGYMSGTLPITAASNPYSGACFDTNTAKSGAALIFPAIGTNIALVRNADGTTMIANGANPVCTITYEVP